MSTRSLLAATLALVLALATGTAHADDPQTTGRALFEEGVALAKEARWLEACPKLEASLKAYPGVGTRGKLAECYEKIGRVASAWSLWKEVASLATKAGDPTREQIANERAKALETKLAYLTIVVPHASQTSGLVVKKNGHDADAAGLGHAEPTDPGPFTIEATAPGKKPSTATVMVTQGANTTYEVPPLESAAPPPPPPAPTPAPVAEPEPSCGWQKPTGLAIAGVGVVALGVGTVLGLSAKSTYDDAFDRGACDRATNLCTAQGQSDVDGARSKATLATVGFVAGGALLAGGLFLFFTAPKGTRTGLVITPSSAGLAGSF